MKKINILKFILAILVNYFILVLISLGISYYFNFNFKNTLFVVGILVFIVALCSNISGNSMGLSLQSLGNVNSQYVANVNLKANQHENNNNRPQVNIKDLIHSTLLFASIIILITQYFI